MPELAADARDEQTQRPVAEEAVEHVAADKAGNNGLAHIEGDDHERVFRAVGAVEIRQTGVAAAVLTDVVMDDEVRSHDRAVDAAEKIRYQQHHRRRKQIGHGYASSSPF